MYRKCKNSWKKYTLGEAQRHSKQKINTQVVRTTHCSIPNKSYVVIEAMIKINISHKHKTDAYNNQQGKQNKDTSKGKQTK